ncbi:MAG: ABC transporter permease [Spirochaetia bacterium]|jgi:lipoprotein-releasing system permease protein|nr:ABC transporter permease [Spirochaetia bacterium]
MVNKWTIFLADRYIRARRTEKKNTTQKLSILGLSAGVITLVAVMSIMNGLQLGFINDILEIESYHLRINNPADVNKTKNILAAIPSVASQTVFSDVQTLLQGRSSKLEPVVVRMMEDSKDAHDKGFMTHLGIIEGEFDIGGGYKAVIGNELAKYLHVSAGNTINIVSLSGSSFTSLCPGTLELTITGVFQSGYYEFDRGMVFISDIHAPMLNPGTAEGEKIIGIKLKNQYRDMELLASLKTKLPDGKVVSWREYNKSFFSALRIEKITMMLLIALIFVVIGVNIFNSIKRTVAEKLEDIAVLYSLGAPDRSVKRIFLIEGVIIGIAGGGFGIAGGLLLIININELFAITGQILSGLSFFVSYLASASGFFQSSSFTLFPEDYFYLTEIPVRILLPEMVLIFIFAFLSAVLSAWFASKKLSVKNPAEYLRYE